MPSLKYHLSAFLTAPLLLAPAIEAKAVFAHYLLSTVNSTHAAQDIDAAKALGFDAFALDILDANASYAANTAQYLFSHAESTGFKLFFSMDLSAYPHLTDFKAFMKPYLNSSAYYLGPNGKPFLSTFDDGGYTSSNFSSFLSSLGTATYFVPDFDQTSGYYSNPPAWNNYWDSVIQGAFSWETAWPAVDNSTPVNESISQDLTVQNGLKSNGKTYMMPLSTLQYKRLLNENGCSSFNTHYYRIGEVNMPQRMTDILAMSTAPDFVEVITWNDGGESHYMGSIWPEGQLSCENLYATQTQWDHSGWQPIFQSFIGAYKAGGNASSMAPPSGSTGVGAMWYHTIFKNATCAGDNQGKPMGWQGAQDAVNYAVVLPSPTNGMQIQVSSGGSVLQTIKGVAGLNYGSVPGIKTGAQVLNLLDSSGKVLKTASGGMSVTADTNGVCNFNYQVAGLK